MSARSGRPGRNALPDFESLRVAVAGDLICDHYIACEPRGLSREAPVMVLRHLGERIGAGGAANVARNLRALGALTSCIGAVGRDERGRELIELLEREGIDVSGVASVPGWTTPTKTRVIAAEPRRWPQQVLRIDREPAGALDGSTSRQIAQRALERGGELDALVVSDYGYGAVCDELAGAVVALSRSGVVVVLDPRRRVQGFEGVTALTPNVAEVAQLAGWDSERLGEPAALAQAAAALLRTSRARHLLITRGNLGMALWGEEAPSEGLFVEASGAGNVTDVSGAGDTAAAVFALALAAGTGAPRAMELANAAAGVVVMENGTAACSVEQLRAALPITPPPVKAASRPTGGTG